MIARKNRFTKHLFEKTFKKCRRIKIGDFLFLVSKGRQRTRVSVVVGKKISKKAVVRNRIRRQIYETIRPEIQYFSKPWNIIFLYKGTEIFQTAEEFQKAFQKLQKQLASQNSSFKKHGKK